MGSPFLHDYLQVGLEADQPANPETDTDFLINPEILVIRLNTDTEEIVVWNPETASYISFSSGGAFSGDTDDVAEGSTNLYFTDNRAKDAAGAALVDGTTVNFSYNGGTHQITAEVQAIATTHFAANVVDTDGTLAANSDTRLATQKAVKTYVDTEVAGAGSGALTLISEVVTSSSAADVTFSSIPATYRDLEVRVRGRASSASVEVDIRMQFNGDTTATNYQWARFYSGGGTFSAQDHSDPSIWVGSLTGSTGQADASSGFSVDIMNYRDTTWHKITKSHGGFILTTNDELAFLSTGLWKSAAAITSIKVFPVTGNYVDNTVVSLYGRM